MLDAALRTGEKTIRWSPILSHPIIRILQSRSAWPEIHRQAQIAISLGPAFTLFCQYVTFLANIVHGIMVVILSLTRKATKNFKITISWEK